MIQDIYNILIKNWVLRLKNLVNICISSFLNQKEQEIKKY